MMAVRPRTLMVGAALATAFAVTGCATEKYVNTHVAAVDTKIDTAQSEADAQKLKIAEHDQMLASMDRTTREAYQRAEAAGKLAEGKFLYNVTLQDDGYKFKTNKYALTDDEKSKLTELAGKLKQDDKNVYLEDPGPHRRHRHGRLQPATGRRAGRGGAPVPQRAGRGPQPDEHHLLRRDRARGRQQVQGRPLQNRRVQIVVLA